MLEAVIFGVKLRIDFSFLVFSALIFLVRDGMTILSFFTVCMIHEIGHCLAICLSGGKIASITLYGTGIIMKPCRSGLFSLKNELFILLSGSAVNITLYLILKNVGGLELFSMLNLGAAVFNLMPYSSLDGGAVLRLLGENPRHGKIPLILLAVLQTAISIFLFLITLSDSVYFPVFCISLFYFVSEIKRFR